MERCSITIGAPTNLTEKEQLDFLDQLDIYAEANYGTYYGYYRKQVHDFFSGYSWSGIYEFNNLYDSKQLLKYAAVIVE